MAGGPSTPELVIAAARAGALGFLAAGYLSADAMRRDIAAVRAATSDPFGVNVFVPGAPTTRPARLSRYLVSLAGEATALGADLGAPTWDDDAWPGKVEALLAAPPPLVSFTFGCPPAQTISALADAGAIVAVTVTSSREAALATAAGADCLCVQGAEAGAHRGTFTNGASSPRGTSLGRLMSEVARLSDLPRIAAGGVMNAEAVRAMLAMGAVAVQCGTAFLRCPESGAHPVYKAALADRRYTSTALTRAFSGRPARGLVNDFIRAHADAPPAYPEVNNATRPLRAAAARAGDAARMSLWAGTGFREATALPLADVVALLDPTPHGPGV